MERAPVDPARLYREHAAELKRYVRRLTGDPDVADDIVQEAFVRLIERGASERGNLRGWLFTTATNAVRDRARRSRRARTLSSANHSLLRPQGPPSDPLRTVERSELRARLFAALADLNERERVAVLMREEGFTHREIADTLDTTTGTIGTLLARALAKLARSLSLDSGDLRW